MKYCIVLFIFIFGCTTVGKENQYILRKSGELVRFNTSGDINPYTHYLKYYWDESEQKEWLFYVNEMLNELIIYNATNGEIEKRLRFEERGPNGVGRLAGILPHRMDSIFMTSVTYPDRFFLTDSSGLIKQRYVLDTIPGMPFKPCLRGMYSHLSVDNYVSKGKINLNAYIPYEVENRDLFKENIRFEYDLEKKKISNFYKFPVFEIDSKSDLSQFSCTQIGDNTMYSFFYNEDILVQNSEGKYTSYPSKSKYQKKSLSQAYDNSLNFKGQLRQVVSRSKYLSVLHDDNHSFSYRYFYPGYEVSRDEDPQKYIENAKGFSIQVIDSTFKVVGELQMTENTYNPDMSFVANDGLYLALHYLHPHYNPDSLKFEKFNVITSEYSIP